MATKKHSRRRILVRSVLLGAAVMFATNGAQAQGDWPSRPIRMLVGFAAGGPTDAFARVLAKKLGEQMGQQVIIDNRPGANSNLAAEATARAPADGYTFFYNTASLAINAGLYPNLKYDARKDLAPVALVMALPAVLVATSSVPVKTPADFVAYVKAHRSNATYASGGAGNTQHLGMAMVLQHFGLEATHVPYKGSAQAYPDLLSGRVQFMIDSVAALEPHIKEGKLKPIAVLSAQRSPKLPSVPTMAESGMPGFELEAWYGVMAPARTPAYIVNRMSAEIAKAMASDEVKAGLAVQGGRSIVGGPEMLSVYLDKEIVRYTKIIRDIDLKPE